MKYIFDLCLNLLSKAVGSISLLLASISAGTMSTLGIYEFEMPTALRIKDEESEAGE